MITKSNILNLVYEIEEISNRIVSRTERTEIQNLLKHYKNNILDLDKAKEKLNSELEEYLKLKSEKRIIDDSEMIQFIKEKIKLIDDYKEDIVIKSTTLKTSIIPSTVNDFDHLNNRPNLSIFYYPGIYKESKNKFNEFIQNNVESPIDFINRNFHKEFIKYIEIKNNKIEDVKELNDDLIFKFGLIHNLKNNAGKQQLLIKYDNAKQIINNILSEEHKLEQLTKEITSGRKLTIDEFESIINDKYAGLNFNYNIYDLNVMMNDIDDYMKKISYVKIPPNIDPAPHPYKPEQFKAEPNLNPPQSANIDYTTISDPAPIENIPIQIPTSPNDIINSNLNIPTSYKPPQYTPIPEPVKIIPSTINTKTIEYNPPTSPIINPSPNSSAVTLSNFYDNLKNLIKTITPDWLEDNVPIDSKTAILTGGFVAIFGLVASGIYAFRQISIVYKKNSNKIETKLKKLYSIDSIIGTTILEFIYDGFQDPSIKKQFNNNKHAYNNELYNKYIGVFQIINELDDKYKIRLLSDIKRGEYSSIFEETTNEFVIRPIVRIHFVVYTLLYRKYSKEQFIKMLEL